MAHQNQDMPREIVVVHGLHRKIYKFLIYEDGREIMQFVRFDNIEGAFSQNPHVETEDEHKKYLAKKAATDFAYHALEIEANRDFLKKKFPKSVIFPRQSPTWKKEWCTFCLGSELCAKIYNEMDDEPSEKIAPRIPLLSIVIHLNQYTLFKLLDSLHEWFLKIGMEKSLGRWIYAVLACTEKPLTSRFRDLFELLYFDYVKRLGDCDDKSERSILYVFLSILDTYFDVNFDQI